MSRSAKDRILAIMGDTPKISSVITNERFGKDYSLSQVALYCKSLVEEGVLIFEGCETGFRLNQNHRPRQIQAIHRAPIGELDAQSVF